MHDFLSSPKITFDPKLAVAGGFISFYFILFCFVAEFKSQTQLFG